MKHAVKIVARQDCDYAINPGSNHETSIKLTDEIRDLIVPEKKVEGEKVAVKLIVFKEDFVKCAGYIVSHLPLLDKSGSTVHYKDSLYSSLFNDINNYFSAGDFASYSCELVYNTQRSSCLQGLPSNLNLRHYLVEKSVEMKFTRKDNGDILLNLRVGSYGDVADTHGRGVLQSIIYGAPGTGKSCETKRETNGKLTFRTTFHPDSDYSTFVGAYKPTMKAMPRVAMINDGKDAVRAGGEDELKTVEEIAYDFIPQAFVKAYVAAWQNMAAPDDDHKVKPVFLVIEEINRGNCAQIFGDLFQLLDRNDAGFSDYPIDADDDLARFLAKEKQLGALNTANLIKCGTDADLAAEIVTGKRICLPPNLYIRATMNTSDQSLFPIDSAFKRRWDWEYAPIKDEGKDWYVLVGNDKYKWWSFLEKINAIVYGETDSADKQMGYFFVKLPEGQTEIDIKKFVNKVAFYLWNDVFKDCEIKDDALKLKDEKGNPGEPIKFTDFFQKNSNVVDEKVVKDLFVGLGVELVGADKTEGSAEKTEGSEGV